MPRRKRAASRSPSVEDEEYDYENSVEEEQSGEETGEEEQSGGEDEQLEEEQEEEIVKDDVHIRSKTQQARYLAQLESRPVEPQRFADSSVLNQIKLYKMVVGMFTALECKSLVFPTQNRSYKCLTLEFFATFSKDPHNCTMEMEFSLGNEYRTLNVDQLNDILEAPKGVTTYFPNLNAQQKLWYMISGRTPFVSGSTLAADIVNPCIRIAHRIIASVLYGRQECSKVRACELVCLYDSLHVRNINVGWEFACKFEEIARSDTSFVGLGGIVGMIAAYFGVDLTRYTSLEPRLLDRDYLLATRQFHYDAETCQYSFFIAQEGAWFNVRSPGSTPFIRSHWYSKWIKKITPSWEELQAANQEDEGAAATATAGPSSGPEPAAFLNTRPIGHSDHPARAARSTRARGTQSDEIAALRDQVDGMSIAQDSMVQQITGIQHTQRSMVQQIAGMATRNIEQHRMLQELYFQQHGRHFDMNTPWPPSAE